MKNRNTIILSLLIAFILAGPQIFAQSSEELYQKGVQLEEIKGEIEQAIDVFSTVLKERNINKETASMAQLHIGLCYEKLGKEKINEAISAFNKVVNFYPGQKEVVNIAKEKLASLNAGKTDIQEIKDVIAEWDKAYESKDVGSYCSFFSNEFVKNSRLGTLKKMEEFMINYYFSKWKTISLSSKIKSVTKTGYNYVVDQQLDYKYTDWNENVINKYGTERFLTLTKEDGQWKILGLYNKPQLPENYKSLTKYYTGLGSRNLAYVCHATHHVVSVIDLRTDSLAGIIPSGNGPGDIAFSQDRGYIANFNSDNITVFDKNTNKQIALVPAGQHPVNLLVTDDDKFVLITHQSNDGLWIMSTKDKQIINKLPNITGEMMVKDFFNRKIYLSGVFLPMIFVIDSTGQTIVKEIAVGGRPLDEAITPDGEYLYVANFNLSEVEKISTKTDSVVAKIADIDSARGMAISPDGKFAYTTNVIAGTVMVIDLKTDSKIKTIYVGRMPTTISVDKNNDCAYVSNQGDSTISVIDMKKNEVIKTISVADNPIRVRIY